MDDQNHRPERPHESQDAGFYRFHDECFTSSVSEFKVLVDELQGEERVRCVKRHV